MKKSHPGIYIHIPFCRSKCGYCDFYSVTDLTCINSFVDALVMEINLISAHLNPSEIFDTIYFGGGTPFLLSKNQLQILMESLYTNFSLSKDINITLEVNPGTLSEQPLKDIKTLGVNRLSIGFQSFIDEELKLLNRIHTSADNFEAFNISRLAGFEDISIDLIFAIPNQTLGDWKYSLDKAIGLKPEHISVYNLTYEKGTPFYNLKEAGHLQHKNEDEELLFYTTAIDRLQQNGYIHYEISNFAQNPKLISKHNIKYWNHTNYLGFGPSAHSLWQDKRWSNDASIISYMNNLNEGKYPDRSEENINRKTKEFEKIFLSLRTISGLNIIEFNESFKCSFMDKYKNEVDELLNSGFAQLTDNTIHLTSKGLYICDEIVSNFACI